MNPDLLQVLARRREKIDLQCEYQTPSLSQPVSDGKPLPAPTIGLQVEATQRRWKQLFSTTHGEAKQEKQQQELQSTHEQQSEEPLVVLQPQTTKARRNISLDSLHQTPTFGQPVSDGVPPTTSLQQVEAIILGLQEESLGEDYDDIPEHTGTSMPLSTYNNGGLISCSANDATSELERDRGMRLNLDKVTTKENHELQSRREQQLDKSHDSQAAPRQGLHLDKENIQTKPPGWGAYAKKTENKNNVSQSIHNPSTHNSIELHPSEAGHFTVCMLVCVYVCVCHGVCVCLVLYTSVCQRCSIHIVFVCVCVCVSVCVCVCVNVWACMCLCKGVAPASSAMCGVGMMLSSNTSGQLEVRICVLY
jgi:hypothetical protein